MRIYADTSVIGGCLDAEFEASSRRLFEKFIEGEIILVVSELTLLELQLAPEAVRSVIDAVPHAHKEMFELTEEAARLAGRYIAEGIIGAANLLDAQHIAIATVARVDALASWNFKHIVNLRRARAFNAVTVRDGYEHLEIRTPLEVIGDET